MFEQFDISWNLGFHRRVREGLQQPPGVSHYWWTGGAQARSDGCLGGRRQGGLHQGQARPGRQLQLRDVYWGARHCHDTQGKYVFYNPLKLSVNGEAKVSEKHPGWVSLLTFPQVLSNMLCGLQVCAMAEAMLIGVYYYTYHIILIFYRSMNLKKKSSINPESGSHLILSYSNLSTSLIYHADFKMK